MPQWAFFYSRGVYPGKTLTDLMLLGSCHSLCFPALAITALAPHGTAAAITTFFHLKPFSEVNDFKSRGAPAKPRLDISFPIWLLLLFGLQRRNQCF